MTKVYFVRHAEPVQDWADNRTRPLTEEGRADSRMVTEFFAGRHIDRIYCSPYRRSLDTIRETAEAHKLEIVIDERLRERDARPGSNSREQIRLRWEDHERHEEGGESIAMVQRRNLEVLGEILSCCQGKTVVVGTHGTALSTILQHWNPDFGSEDFFRILDWMPYIVELDFEGGRMTELTEHLHLAKRFQKRS